MKFKTPLWAKLVLLIASVAAAAYCGYGWRNPDAVETPGEKSEWADLQGIEFAHRTDNITKPEFVDHGDDEWMGLRGLDGKNVWILLNPKSPPYYKQMPPDVNYVLQKSVVMQLEDAHWLGYTTKMVLESHEAPEAVKP